MSASSTCCSELREAKGLGRGDTAGKTLACLTCYHGGWYSGLGSGGEAVLGFIGGVRQAGQTDRRLCPMYNGF